MEESKLVKYESGQLQKVGNAIAITSKLLKKNAEVYFENALEKGKLGKYEEAISDYTKAIQLDPNFTTASANRYCLMAIKYYSEDNFEEAKTCFLKHIELTDELFSYRQLISLYIREQEFDTAIHYLEIAISKFPENSELYLIKGQVKSEFLGVHRDAINDFTKAIEIERKTESKTKVLYEACLERSKAKAELGDKEGSERDYLIANIYKKSWRIRNEGMNEDEKKVFGII